MGATALEGCGPETVSQHRWTVVLLRFGKVQGRRLRRPPGVLVNFEAVSGDLTGEAARPILWCGRPRPRSAGPSASPPSSSHASVTGCETLSLPGPQGYDEA